MSSFLGMPIYKDILRNYIYDHRIIYASKSIDTEVFYLKAVGSQF